MMIILHILKLKKFHGQKYTNILYNMTNRNLLLLLRPCRSLFAHGERIMTITFDKHVKFIKELQILFFFKKNTKL